MILRSFIIGLLLLPGVLQADPITDGAKAVYRAADVDWGGKTLKWSFVLTAVATNGLRMLKEADQWDEKEILPGDTYHAVDAVYIAGCLALGFMAANICQHEEWTWQQKAALLGGTALLTWEAGEGVYKAARYQNWFDNDPAHNRCAIPYYVWKDGALRDRFVSTNRTTTPLLHTGRIAVGTLLFSKVP